MDIGQWNCLKLYVNSKIMKIFIFVIYLVVIFFGSYIQGIYQQKAEHDGDKPLQGALVVAFMIYVVIVIVFTIFVTKEWGIMYFNFN